MFLAERLPPRFSWFLRFAWAIALLYLFLVGINVLESSIKVLTKGAVHTMIQQDINPLAALAIGVLITVMVQSSSATTSMVVAAVGTNVVSVETAVPIIMGANIGTSVTSTLVALGHVTRSEEFRRAYAGATVHDFFNILTVAILLPLELFTRWLNGGRGFLSEMAHRLIVHLPHDHEGEKSKSVIKQSIQWLGGHIHDFFHDVLGLEGVWLTVPMFIFAVLLILGTLLFITKNMRMLMADNIERWLNGVLKRSVFLGWCVGVAITVMVQSSSITTSLLVPMFGAGILALEAGFPILVGANIGTTVTALLAALVVTDNREAAMTIAVVHLLFNICGTLLFLPLPATRRIPILCANWMASRATENKLWIVAYLAIIFVFMPLLGWLVWQ